MKGRKKEVTDDQKKLQGHSRFVKNVPDTKPIEKLWKKPTGLKDTGSQVWKVCGEILVGARVLTDLDQELFKQLCFTADAIQELREVLSQEGYVVTGQRGTRVKHPAASMLKSAMADLKWLCEKFGLNPLDRTRINLPVDVNPDDPVREFFFGKLKK